MGVVVIAFRVWWHRAQRMPIERQHCCCDALDKLKQQSTVNTEAPKTIIKYYLQFSLITMTFLIHLRDQVLHVWSQVDTIPGRNIEERRTRRQSDFAVGRSTFNPPICIGSTFRALQQYQLPGSGVLVYRVVTIRRILWKVAPWGRSVIFGLLLGSNCWERLSPVALGRLRPRGWIFG